MKVSGWLFDHLRPITNVCAINGIFAYHQAANLVDRQELILTRDQMRLRGPDGCGEWVASDERVALAHRRLSVIDLTGSGAQPMLNGPGSLVVTFNGEIYNYRELRKQLECKGYVFRSNSDTEVLLHLYAHKGGEMVHDLRGMFAFAIWNASRRELFLARDPYGIKPLYYADNGLTFRFASQVKALLAGACVQDEVDAAGVIGFLTFGSVPEPLTTVKAIRALPAGHTLVVSCDGAGKPRHYRGIAQTYALAEVYAQTTTTRRLESAHAALLDSVRHHLIADVPVGAFLSAGVDSSALVGLMRDAGQSRIETVTLSFEEFRGTAYDEAPIAEDVARTYGTRHTTRVVTRAEFEADLPRILAAMDQPTIDGINTWFVSKAAAEMGLKVAISGVGGDELLGGYPSFRDIPRWLAWLWLPAAIPYLGTAVRRAAVAIGPERFGMSPKSAGLIEYGGDHAGVWLLRRALYMPWELSRVLDPDTVAEGLARLDPIAAVRSALEPQPYNAFARVATLESALYMRNQLLRDTDWASMAHSLEVRTPLVDATLLKEFAKLGPPDPAKPTKYELITAVSTPLPMSVTTRNKTGFTIPVGEWTAGGGTSRSPGAQARAWALDVLGNRHPSLGPLSARSGHSCEPISQG